jgi:xanthine/uracil permease
MPSLQIASLLVGLGITALGLYKIWPVFIRSLNDKPASNEAIGNWPFLQLGVTILMVSVLLEAVQPTVLGWMSVLGALSSSFALGLSMPSVRRFGPSHGDKRINP